MILHKDAAFHQRQFEESPLFEGLDALDAFLQAQAFLCHLHGSRRFGDDTGLITIGAVILHHLAVYLLATSCDLLAQLDERGIEAALPQGSVRPFKQRHRLLPISTPQLFLATRQQTSSIRHQQVVG
ncbi:MAG: hypothetical protein H0W78_13230 [Planctomycetes bacterium]|nr:hypothetical protein [Planctomycetota bacterium]